MVVKTGRFGKFLACTGYPECKTTRKYVKTTGAKCPECGADVIEKVTKKKKVFYGCSRYPECTFATNTLPLSTQCPSCGKLMVQQGRNKAKCLGCGAVMPLEQKGDDGDTQE